jgi:hypothetical protein
MKQYLARARLALSLALSLAFVGGCGGGGGGSDPVPVVQPFLVITTVNGLPVPALGVKYSVTMESGDRIEIKASPEGAQWTVSADGNVLQAEASQDGSSFSAVLNSPKGGQVVIKATSGNDPSQQVEITAVVNSQRHTRRDAVPGEVQVWRETNTRNDGGSSVAKMQATTTAVAGDGAHTLEYRDITNGPPGTLTETSGLDADGNRLSRQLSSGDRCSYTPVRELLDYPLYYGKTWPSHWQYSCQLGDRETADAVTTVDGFDSITVGQGTHDALRLTTQVAFTQSNDTHLTGGSLGQAAYGQDIVCWWSVSLKRTVKCTTTYHYVGTAPADHPKTVVQELLSAQ